MTLPTTKSQDPAAIIFTSGSTGPAKGVLYTHEMFDAQVREIQQQYDLQPGGADLACFPLFGLFNSAMGVTTVFPQMDFTRPASCEPEKLLVAATDWQVTQAFASPAVWKRVSRHCEQTGQLVPTLGKVFSCGAPVPATVLQRTLQSVAPNAKMHTPYGATEALPVATISAEEVLGETAEQTDQGAGICVGRRFADVDWRVIRITDAPIATIDDAEDVPMGEIGELIVRAPQVSPAYVERETASAAAKIRDGETIWHRMGDVGYLDDRERFWYCGRKAHRVATRNTTHYTICCEAIFNRHPQVARSALVGEGLAANRTPVLVVEPVEKKPPPGLADELRQWGRQHAVTRAIGQVVFHQSLPVDVRHNAKINRELLAEWATRQIGDGKLQGCNL